MSWPRIKLEDICTSIVSGGTPLTSKDSYYEPAEIPWLKTKEVNYTRIYSTESYISKEGLDNSSAKLIPPHTVIMAMYGQGDTAGRVAINMIPLSTNQACCNMLIDSEKANYEYVYYCLSSLYNEIVLLKTGPQPNLSARKIRDFEIPLPNLEVQAKIASILRAYDNLIENNRRQIALLEEASQRLYKEWFDDLRYPTGEASADRTSWTQLPLTECAKVIRGRSYTSGEIDGDEGVALVNLKNLRSFGGWNDGAEKTYSGAFKEEQRVSAGDIIMGVTDMTKERRLVGHVALVPDLEREAIISMDLVKLTPIQVENLYLYAHLRFSGIAENIALLANGTNVLHLKPQILSCVQIPIPSQNLQSDFARHMEPMVSEMNLCSRRIASAQEARDRLLSKLMSGEIEVEG